MRRILASLVFVSSLSGCAVVSDYWRKPTKYKEMPEEVDNHDIDRREIVPVATLSLDATRRLVISQLYNPAPGKKRFTCPEPPPDVALNILAQVAASAKAKNGAEGELKSTYEAIAQVLSSRTSTVEVWRTTSSTFCVLLMNGQDAKATEYLEAANVAIGKTTDAAVLNAAASAFVTNLIAQAVKDALAAKAKEDEAVAKAKAAAEAKSKAEAECGKVPDDKKATDPNCLKAKAMT